MLVGEGVKEELGTVRELQSLPTYEEGEGIWAKKWGERKSCPGLACKEIASWLIKCLCP